MSSSLLALRESLFPLRVAQSSVRYATKKEYVGEQRYEIMRRALYPPTIRNRPSPTGTWRPDVGRRLQRAIPSVQAHDTIERAWFLHKRHIRRQRQAELERKFRCMTHAMEVLMKISPNLYAEANKEEDPRVRTRQETELAKTLRIPEKKALEARVRGLFPRELRIPTDTPSRDGWNYDWKPVIPRRA
ncbi:uncharacterized protein LAESUDRAFT_696760 [Laetiporus sulphureus 93-53]|uniref:Large ribosomal subunit protein mL40 n=1 Tax=Laetiporus sulphureus 93-53 TaxID=1314785 RepID=A0A165F9A6_9APHY|nr:uncharacterized protein LAESUDRAFT_696760 [Laetiporus sulphureus 93-53]KZT08626.1 hypothetical protein LAESUDRAFT_696760 [Laetiporus sulphureus 93-53]